MNLTIHNLDDRQPDHQPPHAMRLFRFRLASIGTRKVRLGASVSDRIGWNAYVRIGAFSVEVSGR